MIRVLFFLAFGGAVTLTIFAESGSSRFEGWALGFLIAAFALGLLWGIGGYVARRVRAAAEAQEAVRAGRVRPARILSRRQTGTFINEQPEVEFTLLVDRRNDTPFVTTTRKVISLLDVHQIDPGSVVAVAHPDPDHGDVHLVDAEPPDPTHALDPAAAATASELPKRRGRWAGRRPGTIAVYLLAFLIGAIGVPFLVTPNAVAYAELLLSGRLAAESDRLDHAVLFAPEPLSEALAALTDELGHDEVFSVTVHDVRLTAEAPGEPGGDTADSVLVQDARVQNREPALIQPRESVDEDQQVRFAVHDIDWDAVLARIPRAEELVSERGLADAELEYLAAQRDSTALAAVEVVLHFSGTYGSELVRLNASGMLLPEEELSLLPEVEREVYLFDPDHFVAALDQMIAAAESERAIRLMHQGDWLSLEAMGEPAESTERPAVVEVQFRNGRVEGLQTAPAPAAAEARSFSLSAFDWRAVLEAIPQAQEALPGFDRPDTRITHAIAERSRRGGGDDPQPVVRMYFTNAEERSGFVEIHVDGSIGHVVAPSSG